MGITQYSPRAYVVGADVTVTATAPILAGRLVAAGSTSTEGNLTGQHAAAAAPAVLGVAWNDCPTGSQVAIATAGIVRLTASAPVTAGTLVAATADGKVAPAGANPPIGYAVTSGAADGSVHVKLK
ncbi:capsid cement protein [Tsukamurella paurometabola]|uniref:DUF2190 family protein n=1 Tax=Tsukamurella paurometabola TaxID=2061 RepID=A0ABS5NJD2_TSUPA|nr:capsid cement protein [Tsukamurella paurometabola]MBS4104013.1 DUF2190 family protein [Tsukamurella paurometabola]